MKALNNSSEKKEKRERYTEDFGVWMMDWFPSETFETYLLYLIYDYIYVTLIKIIIPICIICYIHWEGGTAKWGHCYGDDRNSL